MSIWGSIADGQGGNYLANSIARRYDGSMNYLAALIVGIIMVLMYVYEWHWPKR